MAELLSAMSENGSGLSIHTELLSAMSENRSGLSIHTECSIHTGTSDAQAFKCSREIYTLYTLDTHLLIIFTVIRRQESSKYKPPQTTPSMLRCFSPLSEVEDCWTTSVAQGSSRQATTTDTIHQPTIEITQWRDYCPSRILYGGGFIQTPTDPKHMTTSASTNTKHTEKSRTSVTNRTISFPVRQPTKQPRWLSTNHPLPSQVRVCRQLRKLKLELHTRNVNYVDSTTLRRTNQNILSETNRIHMHPRITRWHIYICLNLTLSPRQVNLLRKHFSPLKTPILISQVEYHESKSLTMPRDQWGFRQCNSWIRCIFRWNEFSKTPTFQ